MSESLARSIWFGVLSPGSHANHLACLLHVLLTAHSVSLVVRLVPVAGSCGTMCALVIID